MAKTLTLWMVCASLMPAAPVVAQPLFAAPPAGADSLFGEFGVLRSRPAAVDVGLVRRAFSAASSREPVSISLNLFSDTVYRGMVEHVGPTSAGYTVSGALDGVPFGSFVLVVNGDVVVGTIDAGGERYEIGTIQPGVQAVRQIDPASMPLADDDWVPGEVRVPVPGETERAERRRDPVRVGPVGVPRGGRGGGFAADAGGGADGAEDGSRIDVLMLYTPRAARETGGADRMRANADLWIAWTNRVYGESGVIHRLWIVGVHPFDPVDERFAGNKGQILGALARSSHAASLRDRVGADLVHLMAVVGGGQASLPGPFGISCMAYRCNTLDHDGGRARFFPGDAATFAHEIGHNMGLHHDRYSLRVRRGLSLMHFDPPYKFGYVSPTRHIRTIMSTRARCTDEDRFTCPRVPRFSNPYRTWNGEPLGVPGDEPSSSIDGPADAVRAMNEARREVANWRVAPCIRDGSIVHLQGHDGHWLSAENDGGGAIDANLSAPGAWETFSLLAPGGGCVETGRAVHLRTGAGFYWRAEGGGGATLDAAGAAAGAWETFRMHRIGDGSVIRSGDFMRLQAPSGHYVVATEGDGAVRANGLEPGAWETFRVVVRP